MTVAVRNYLPEDLSRVCELIEYLGYRTKPEDLAARLKLEQCCLWVATHDARVAGFVATSQPIPLLINADVILKVTAIAVDPRSQRLGVGKLLLDQVVKFATTSAVAMIELSSAKQIERTAAHAFYPSYGFYDASDESVVYRLKVAS